MPIVLNGNIQQAWSQRSGNNFITSIKAFDGGYASQVANFNQPFPAGTPQKEVIGTMISSLKSYGIDAGAIGDYPGFLSRANGYSGATMDLLRELTGGEFFVDNGIAHALGDNEAIAGTPFVINSASGLLGTPIREVLFFKFDMIFEPRLFVGQQILLDSSTGANFNGLCKVTSLKHSGIISPSVSGAAVSTVGLASGTYVGIQSETAAP